MILNLDLMRGTVFLWGRIFLRGVVGRSNFVFFNRGRMIEEWVGLILVDRW
jgi:hypothetical protein